MLSNFVIAKTIIEGEWSSIINKLNKCTFFECNDYDLKNAITGIAIKSESGNINDLLRSKQPEKPEDYSLTILHEHPSIKKLINFFELETTRIRIFKQKPFQKTPMHIDYNNTFAKENDFLLRIWTALTEDSKFIYLFKEGEALTQSICLKKSESVIFNPDKVYHGAINLSTDKIRYSLNIIGKPNKWVKEFIESEKTVIL